MAYYSKSLNAVEQNYEIHDKEMLAIIRALEDWHHFLEGAQHKFKIWTDHKNLEYFMSAKKLNCRQAQWSLYLSWFNFAMHHHPGCSMGKSNALSCRADHGTGGETMTTPFCSVWNSFQPMQSMPSLDCHWKEGEEHDIFQEIRNGNRTGKQKDAVAKAAEELRKSKGKSI